MFVDAYDSVLEDEPGNARETETEIFSNAIAMMQRCVNEPGDEFLQIGTVHHIVRLWQHLLNDVASAENSASSEFKSGIVSIGIFVLKHCEKMRNDRSLGFDPIIEIMEIIREGLK